LRPIQSHSAQTSSFVKEELEGGQGEGGRTRGAKRKEGQGDREGGKKEANGKKDKGNQRN